MKKTTPLLKLRVTSLFLSFSFLISCSVDKEELDKKRNIDTKSEIKVDSEDEEGISTARWTDKTVFRSNYEGLRLPTANYRAIIVELICRTGECDFDVKVVGKKKNGSSVELDHKSVIVPAGMSEKYPVQVPGGDSAIEVSGSMQSNGFYDSVGDVELTGFYTYEKL